jgi:hypothetical protein
VAFAHLDIKKSIEEGLFVGPRIFGAGMILKKRGYKKERQQ